MTRESEDYYKRLRTADYQVNPFNMKMLHPVVLYKHQNSSFYE